MGDMADWIIETGDLDILYEYQGPRNLICRRCKTQNLSWDFEGTARHPRRWFLADENGEHVCPNGLGKCPSCGAKTILKEGKFGPFYGCINFPKCKGTRNHV